MRTYFNKTSLHSLERLNLLEPDAKVLFIPSIAPGSGGGECRHNKCCSKLDVFQSKMFLVLLVLLELLDEDCLVSRSYLACYAASSLDADKRVWLNLLHA